jgi:branched-chain amino acid transport system substrate-binding protein
VALKKVDRRSVLQGLAAGSVTGAGISFGGAGLAVAQQTKLKIGMMLPKSGTFAQVGDAIQNGFMLAQAQAGNKLGGREVESKRGAEALLIGA